MKTIKISSVHIDIAVCLLMALMIYVVFPFGRWIDHATLSTLLLFGFYYLTYVANRTVTVPLFFRASWRPLLSVLILGGFAVLMAALTYYREGWPFYQLADTGKVTLGQQRAWLFFLVVQLAGITVGIMDELTRQRISPEKPLDEGDRLQQTLSVKSGRKNILIALSDILYIESRNNYVHFTLTGGRQLKTQATLTSLLAQLPSDEFIRIHKSFIVARSHISSFTSRQVCIDAATLPIGRSYAEDVRTRLHAPKIPHSW